MSEELLSLPTSPPTQPTTSTLSSNDKLKLNRIFQSYKPICDELITILSNTDENKFEKQDNKQIIINLEYLIQSLIDITNEYQHDQLSLTYIFDYLMIPISLIINSVDNNNSNNSNNSNNNSNNGGLSLQNHKVLFCIRKESIQLKSFTLLSKLLDNIKITQFKKFINILTIIINYLNQLQQSQQQPNEEFLKILLLNIRLLFKCTQDSFFSDKQIYPKHPFLNGDQFVPFGYTISTLLNLLTQQQQQSQSSTNNINNNKKDLANTTTTALSREIKKELIITLDFIIDPFSKRSLEYYSILFQIFPGTISSLFKMISGDFKLGSVLKVQCLDLFSKIISNTLSDKVKQFILSTTTSSSSSPSPYNSNNNNNNNYKEQINSMFKESELNLYNMFCLIYPTSNSYSGLRIQHSIYSKDNGTTLLTSKLSLDKYQNREALVRSAFTILSNCSNLKSLSPILLEVLVLFYGDSYPQIQDQTKQYFFQLKELKNNNSNFDIDIILQDNFNHLFQSLSILICNNNNNNSGDTDITTGTGGNTQIDEEKKIIVFKLVLSYLNILGNDISSFFSTRIDMIASTLISLSEMQSPSPSIPIESSSSKNLQQSLEESLKIISDNPFEKNQKRSIKSFSNLSLPFINFYSRDSEDYLIKVIELIGKLCDIREWIDCLISNSLLSSSPKRKEIIFCLNHLLIGNNSSNDKNNKNNNIGSVMDFSTVQYILEEVMSPNLLNLVISRDQHLMYSNKINNSNSNTLLSISNKDNDNQLEIYFDNTVTISLVLESIGVLTNIVGNFQTKKYRQIFLSKIIYQLLEKFGLSSLESGSSSSNNNGLIINQCKKTFNQIQISFEYQSIQDIIYKNSDYLLDTIESHMKYLDSFPNTPSIFEGILNITGLGFLPFLSDTIRMILNSLDLAIETSKNIQIFVSILSNIVKVLYNNSKHQLQYQQILLKLNEIKEKRKLKEQENNKKEEKENEKEIEEKEEEKEKQSIQDIKEFFLSHHSKKDDKIEQLNQLDIKNNSLKKQQDQQLIDLLKMETTPQQLGIPNFIETTEIQRQMAQEIIRKSIHFISSKNKIIKMAIIDIVEMGLVIVATGTRKYGGVEDDEDQKEIVNQDDHEQQQQQSNKTNADKGIEKVALFPLIHLVWDSLVKRVSEPDRIIAKKSLEVIQTISNLSLEFISQRFWDQLWPIINRILIDEQSNQTKQQQQQPSNFKLQNNNNYNNNNNSATSTATKKPLIVEIDSSIKTIEESIEIKMKKDKLKYTPSFKVQFVCLQTLKTILLGSAGNRIKQNQIMDIAKTTIYYLNRNQPEQFQLFTMDIWKDVLLRNDPDSLWLLLFNLSNQFSNEIYHFQPPQKQPQLQQHQQQHQLIQPIPNNFQYSSKDIIDFKSNASILFNLIN
ncbi:hypothetical protein ACTFIU_005232 [Dictyostelium citrinum]